MRKDVIDGVLQVYDLVEPTDKKERLVRVNKLVQKTLNGKVISEWSESEKLMLNRIVDKLELNKSFPGEGEEEVYYYTPKERLGIAMTCVYDMRKSRRWM